MKNMREEQSYGSIHLVTKMGQNTTSVVKDSFSDKKICVCDFYISGAENGEIDESGVMSYCDLLIVDHHAPIPYMMNRQITSTAIANKFVIEQGPLNDEYIIVNHTDTDSILSSLIMSGKIKPGREHVEASIAADHTGKENVISDLLQSLEEKRSLRTSISAALLRIPETSAVELAQMLEKRKRQRNKLRELIEKKEFEMHDGIALIRVDEKFDASLLIDLLPEAKVIALASPMPKGNTGKWRISSRLGLTSVGIELNKLNIPNTGGRWNAVSTSRHGGTDLEPEKYVERLKHEIALQ